MPKQASFIPNFSPAYGGVLQKKRKGRTHGRPLSIVNSMHLVLRSTQAYGSKSFLRPANAKIIRFYIKKFSSLYGVKIHSVANVGNHLHFHIKLGIRSGYRPFIRALTAAISISVGGNSKWNQVQKKLRKKFWDRRPFTRIVQGYRATLTLANYLELNRLEGAGYSRQEARMLIESG